MKGTLIAAPILPWAAGKILAGTSVLHRHCSDTRSHSEARQRGGQALGISFILARSFSPVASRNCTWSWEEVRDAVDRDCFPREMLSDRRRRESRMLQREIKPTVLAGSILFPEQAQILRFWDVSIPVTEACSWPVQSLFPRYLPRTFLLSRDGGRGCRYRVMQLVSLVEYAICPIPTSQNAFDPPH